MKTKDWYFIEWENEVFGFGYGSGEEHVLKSLRKFLEAIPETSPYDYEKIEESLTPGIAWLLINILCKEDIIEYGSSPRFGWLTSKGEKLKEYIFSRSLEYLISLVTERDEGIILCSKDNCLCKEGNCSNPFFYD